MIAWRAVANAGISGSDVRDIMLEAVEARFGGPRAMSMVEMLTDNGSAYSARETRIFARQLGLRPCFTPVRSPQSNGISEAFVHILKRDYVRVSPLPDAHTALTSLADWIEDYIEHHPHSGLKMRSPREHRAMVNNRLNLSGEIGARSATATAIVFLCTSAPTYFTVLLVVRLHAGDRADQLGATSSLHITRQATPASGEHVV